MPLVESLGALDLPEAEGLRLERRGRGQALDGDAVLAELVGNVRPGDRDEVGVGKTDRALGDEFGVIGHGVGFLTVGRSHAGERPPPSAGEAGASIS